MRTVEGRKMTTDAQEAAKWNAAGAQRTAEDIAASRKKAAEMLQHANEYQPKTGKLCYCRKGVERDNCPACEGTGQRIDFAAIRARRLDR